MPRRPRVHSPADLASLPNGRTVVVGGRVVRHGPRRLLVADALAAVSATLAAPCVASLGDLVLLEGRIHREPRRVSLRDARVREHAAGRPGGAEWSRLATGGVARHLRARAAGLRAVRAYFDAEAFVEVHTPVRVRSPGLDAHVDAFRAEGGFLITSPELHMKRLLAGGLPRIYQVSPVSRFGELGALHEPEFTMVEWYRAFAGFEATLRDTERLVERVAQTLSGGTRLRRGRRTVDVSPPFDRITVRDAFRKNAGIADAVDLAATDEDRYFQLYVDRVEPALAKARRPTFLVDYPVSQGALARPRDCDPTVVERYELFVFGVELCNGYGELTDPSLVRARFRAERARRRRARTRQHPSDPRFLEALDEGVPPSSGNALGFDRLLALCLGTPGVAETMAFPDSVK